MIRLPPELVEVIVGFVLRPDWRTCRRRVAELIEENNGLVLYYLERQDHWVCSEEAYDEIDEWTLYGKRWLMNAPKDLCIDPRRAPRIPPEDWMYTDHWKWYSHRIKWVNG
jgi:hypothetical protein